MVELKKYTNAKPAKGIRINPNAVNQQTQHRILQIWTSKSLFGDRLNK